MKRLCVPILTLAILLSTLHGGSAPLDADSEGMPLEAGAGHFIPASAFPAGAPIESPSLSPLSPDPLREEETVGTLLRPLADFEEKDRDYEETALRRFEIVFFISLPASLLFSLAGAAAFKAGQGDPIDFTSAEYTYILVSSVGISFAIALHDSRVVFGRSKKR
jgi:hypothetical protein